MKCGAGSVRVPDGEEVLIDGTAGRLLIAPDAADRLGIVNDARVHAENPLRPLSLPVVIEANAGSAREVEQAAATGAHGIGLLRTELLFLSRTVAPALEEQRSLYRRTRRAMPGATSCVPDVGYRWRQAGRVPTRDSGGESGARRAWGSARLTLSRTAGGPASSAARGNTGASAARDVSDGGDARRNSPGARGIVAGGVCIT